MAKLASQNWRGAVIGPHGSGKSTLLESLKPALAAAGRTVVSVTLRDGVRRLPVGTLSRSVAEVARPQPAFSIQRNSGEFRYERGNPIFLIDGYEQLSRLERLRIAWHCRRNHCGLVVTAHQKSRLPTLIDLEPGRELITTLVAELCSQVSTLITAADVAASHDCHGSNVREIFFDLYDRHERRRRTARTSSAPMAYSNPPA